MEKSVDQWFEFCKKELKEGACIGMDFTQYPAASLQTRKKFFEECKMEVVSTPNLVDLVWADRPARP